jgi:Putative prokaryotic signal transducing protein
MDPAQERQRLAELYAQQTDGELEQTATQMDELTSIAREALEAEIAKRGISGQVAESGNDPGEPEFRDLVTIRTFWNVPEANIAKSLLDAAGIDSFLFDENMVNLGLYAIAVHGVKLRVDKDRAEEADRVLLESRFDAADSENPESLS